MDILEILQTLTPAEIVGDTSIFPDQSVIILKDLARYIDAMSEGDWNWDQMSTKVRIGRTEDGSLMLK